MTPGGLPQLRCRTEFTFRQTFAPLAGVAAALEEMGASAAGIVDPGTWGHVKWANAAKDRGYRPLFGTELTVASEDGRKPTCWVLAGPDVRAFYRFSTAARRPDSDLPALLAAEADRCVRFAGGALEDPALFDYVDINPSSALLVRKGIALAKRTKRPLVLTSDNWYASAADASAFLAVGGRERITPQHLLTMPELRAALPQLTDKEFFRAVQNTHDAAARCGSELAVAPLIQVPGSLAELAAAGKAERLRLGHVAEWTDEYEARLQREMIAIAEKAYESYFIVVADLIRWAKQRMLVGPGRGSSAGSLVCYLLRITEVDPLVHDLLFERFIDVTRADLPDIDIDFADSQRDECFTYLDQKYGKENVARVGSINNLRARSVVAEVCKRFAIPDREKFDVFNVLIEYSSGDSRYGHALEDTMTQTEPGKRFMAAHPEAAVMYRLENHAHHTGIHAAGVIVCNEPVSDFCTVGPDGVAHIDKPDAEKLNLLKIDALGLRTLGVIQDSGVVTGDELYALKLNDPEVLNVFNQGRYFGVFQFEGQAQRRVAGQVDINSFQKVDHVTALARPGPLGGGASGHYIARAAGREEIETTHPALGPMLAETYGVVLYQEQVMRIVREIGKFSWAETTVIRKAMSGRKGKEFFDRQGERFFTGAAEDGISEQSAKAIWSEICTFGAWGMNKSHTCSYAMISYWCAWMKRYHPLEYAAACLRNAKDDDQTIGLLRELAAENIEYVPFDIDKSDITWSVQGGRLVGGFTNLVGFGPAKSVAAVEARRLGKMDEKLRAKIDAAAVKFAELRPLHAAYQGMYDTPEEYGCRAGSRIVELAEMPEDGQVLTLVQVVRKELRDENETVRLARRDGRMVSPSLFLDIFVTDDTGEPYTFRVDRFKFESFGRIAAEHLREGDALLVRGKKIPNFNMVKIDRVKCLNRPEALNA